MKNNRQAPTFFFFGQGFSQTLADLEFTLDQVAFISEICMPLPPGVGIKGVRYCCWFLSPLLFSPLGLL